MSLRIDPTRLDIPGTGIFCRAQDANGQWDSVDISHLDRDSFKAFCYDRPDAGEREAWMLNILGIVFGHGHLWEAPKEAKP